MEHGIKTVGVLGAGQMGGGIAQVAALAGFKVLVYDAQPRALDRCRADHAKRLGREVDKGKLTQAQAEAALSGIGYIAALDGFGSGGADIVIEAVVEEAQVKADIFRALAQMFAGIPGRQILASNTSSISITRIAAACRGIAGPSLEAPGQVIGMHFFNPVPVMKLVEVIKGLETTEETTARVIALAQAMGKTPLAANDRPGFVSNRVLMPMINEAFYAWMEGVARPEDIDGIMKLGCNMPMGPLNLADFIGLDTCAQIMNVLAEGLNSERYRPCPLLRQLVTAGRLGVKAGRGVFEYPGK
ncbi:MAG: 3-hydroxybutyryl-CoA dehydrogenase [Planctomyces sp.]|nr:3-hydroxybutyryl-CoA dehydrogenase [Planctomyces sp.]MBA4039718.1 3-hydroxybutyryl-CoA dehydrogenase [Planctomyces sp.]MBA4119816.1 3-hydroxybutyryl-CoA dehydrogenase [Isosphaera sp.]